MTVSRRIPGLDLVRCVAIFLVVLQHSWTMLDLDLSPESVQYPFYSSLIYGVALFVMLSGALQLRTIVSIAEFYRKRLIRVILPFLFWGTIVYAISFHVGKYEEINNVKKAVVMYFPYLVTGKINEAYWFVFLISALYLVTPALQRILHSGKENIAKAIILLIMGIWLCIEAFFGLSGLVGIFVVYLGYYLTGYFIAGYLSGRKYTALVAAVGVLLSYGLNVFMQSNGRMSFVISFCEISCLFALISSINFSGRFFTGLSRYSYMIYLTHFVLIRALYVAFPAVFVQRWYMPVVATIFVLAIEYCICAVIDRLSWMPKKIIGI